MSILGSSGSYHAASMSPKAIKDGEGRKEKRKCDVEVGGRKNFIKTRRQKCGILRKRFALHVNDSWILVYIFGSSTR